LRWRMKKNNLKSMIFQLDENNQSGFRYQQFVQFIKRFNRSDIKIGLILPNPTKNFSDAKIDPLMKAAENLGILPSETMVFLSQPDFIQKARNNGFELIAGWNSTVKEDNKLFQKGADILIKNIDLLNSKWIDGWFNYHPPHLYEPKKYFPMIENITLQLEQTLSTFPGIILEKKGMSVAVHYRMTLEENLPELKSLLKNIMKGRFKYIRVLKGKKVFEFLPKIEWNKGKAIIWIMNTLGLSWTEHKVFYLGDDTTDEDAFRVLRTRGTGILISEKPRKSSADFRLSSPEEVKKWIQNFLH